YIYKEKQPQRKPFLKNLLLGALDTEVFSLPELQTVDRFKDFEAWLKPIEDYVCSCTEPGKEKLKRNEILSCLKDLDLFRAYISEEHRGLNLSETESLKLIETLGILPWLSTYMVKNVMLPVQLISKYGSEDQKKKYFPKIISGEIVPTICLKEKTNGTNINNIESFATLHDNSWILNGEKSFVVNGVNANLFLVFAQCTMTHIFNPQATSLFLVERDFGGISCTNIYETIGRREVPVCTVNFTDTIIPTTNIIGEPNKAFNIMMEMLKPGIQHITGQSIVILRNFINQLLVDVLEMKHFDREFYQFESVKKVLAEASHSLYTMESMAYLTIKLADLHENQDVEIERTITETYCANKCLNSIQSGLQLLGAQTYLNKSSYINMYHDALAFTTLDTNNLDAYVYVATAFLQYMGKSVFKEVYKQRNVSKHPWYNIFKLYGDAMLRKQKLTDHFHPSLTCSVMYFEASINIVKKSVGLMLQRHGAEIMNKQIALLRITSMLTEIFAMTANLSRSSRSYSLGLRHSDIEKNLAVCVTYEGFQRIKNIATEIEENDVLNGDIYRNQLTDLIYRQRKYPMENPLNRIFT
ncbi:PREDICTED: acyl-CoA dehydrogenase family member 9, mitochondrial, partial [Dufourea novaeangliae]|uniref:acyl-CoA dehydrogenase family member 9, mitochondrial n=1 Tax=Dufourea novaeangliae TaxID=178035 RepID=UPI0007676544